jgi:hypothetical protein
MNTSKAWHNKSKILREGSANYQKSNLKIEQKMLVEARHLITKSTKNQQNL